MYNIIRFVRWIYKDRQELFDTALVCSGLYGELPSDLSSAFVRSTLTATPPRQLIRLELLESNDVKRFLMSLTKSNGELPSRSLYGTMRSSVLHLFGIYNKQMDVDFAAEMKTFYKGLKRTCAKASDDRGDKLTEGKEPFDFRLYRLLCKSMIASAHKDSPFAHTFTVLCWNLMCRSSNAASIHYQHISWHSDAATVLFGHMKNDQGGDRPRDPRHIYANPVMPEICPILSLAI
jgi:hypothetical protein